VNEKRRVELAHSFHRRAFAPPENDRECWKDLLNNVSCIFCSEGQFISAGANADRIQKAIF
jgi:hypothetical protein